MGVENLRHAEGLEDAARRLMQVNERLSAVGCYFLTKPNVDMLRTLMRENVPVQAIIETDCRDQQLGDLLIQHCLNGGVGWSLRTDTANDSALSRYLAERIALQYHLDEGMVETLDLALSEALSNAITHGNLGIAGLSGADISQFANYCELRTNRLNDEGHGGRRLDISAAASSDGLEIAVLDRGEGYEPSRNTNDPPPLIGGGLGLEILKTLATELLVTQGGRCLTLRFHR